MLQQTVHWERLIVTIATNIIITNIIISSSTSSSCSVTNKATTRQAIVVYGARSTRWGARSLGVGGNIDVVGSNSRSSGDIVSVSRGSTSSGLVRQSIRRLL